jgi:hypothetical protein
MQYLVEGARGPLPPSPEQAIALLEGTVIPHFEDVIRLKAEGRRPKERYSRAACRSATAPSCSSSRLPRTMKLTASSVTCLHGASSNGK